jgi:translation initiation factor 4B
VNLRPIDASVREKEVAERLEKEREANKERHSHPLSRTSSRTASDRDLNIRTQTPPPAHMVAVTPATSPQLSTSAVQPTLSFASAAAAKRVDAGKVELNGVEARESEAAV